MYEYLQYFLNSFIYTVIDAIALGLGIAIIIRIITWLTSLNGLEKIRENNIATAIIWGIILIILGVFTISGYFIPETTPVQ